MPVGVHHTSIPRGRERKKLWAFSSQCQLAAAVSSERICVDVTIDCLGYVSSTILMFCNQSVAVVWLGFLVGNGQFGLVLPLKLR